MFEADKVIRDKINLTELTSSSDVKVNNNELYQMLRETEEITYPSLESDYVKLYAKLFFPVKGERIWFVPLTLAYLKETGEYEIRIDHSTFRANKGEEQSQISNQLKRVIKRVIDFAKLCNCFVEYIPTGHIHPLYRRGRVKLKYVWDKLMPISEA
ncbi:hypothetical protein HLB03_05240, partial [Acidianus sp. DSM 29099]|nr:hypothetical protein [Acidianus sp. RZ1]